MSEQRQDAAREAGAGDARPPAGFIHVTDLVVALLILAGCAWLYYLTTGFEKVSPLFAQDVPPEFFPRLLLGIIVLLSLILPIEHLFHAQGPARLDKGRSQPIGAMAYITAGLLFVLVLGMHWLGTYLTLVVACVVVPLLWGERRWRLVIPFALAFPTLVLLLFSGLLQVYFEPGILGLDIR